MLKSSSFGRISALLAVVRADSRQWALAMLTVVLRGIATVMVTHAVGGRFIIPVLPALYILILIGVARLGVFLDQFDQEIEQE
jgi:hypothetical protein